MKTFFLLLALFFSTSLLAQSGINILVDLSPAGSFNGVSDKLRGKVKKTQNGFQSERIELSIKSIKTGIDLRDEHLWEHLNAKTHPKATLSKLKAQDGKGSGELEVNGVKVPITLTYHDKGQQVEAQFKVKASDFNLAPKSYLGVGVEDEVTVNVKMDYK